MEEGGNEKTDTNKRNQNQITGNPNKILKTEIYCLLCQEYGHNITDSCAVQATCFNCNIRGHVRRDCTVDAILNPSATKDTIASHFKVEDLYEIDSDPGRHKWLDQLFSFMKKRNTPILTCSTMLSMSKKPLDLYRLYELTMNKGGFIECTKNKGWNDIANQLGFDTSYRFSGAYTLQGSSGAFTLQNHYKMKLFPFESHLKSVEDVDPGQNGNDVKDKVQQRNQDQPHCKFFLGGGCRFGIICRFKHDRDRKETSFVPRPSETRSRDR